MMIQIKINLNSVDNIKKFINIVNTFEADIDVGHGRVILDAKSIMALYSLDLSNDIFVTCHASSEEEIDRFVKEMENFK